MQLKGESTAITVVLCSGLKDSTKLASQSRVACFETVAGFAETILHFLRKGMRKGGDAKEK